jgi:hypothetical protein
MFSSKLDKYEDKNTSPMSKEALSQDKSPQSPKQEWESRLVKSRH